ncbi:NUDIX domain-containing protein [Nocardioides sp.]|uniref:NUDIX domain-containing protein n=1 Tax=Nocardioides sp. TaxID=35761 RepID=UPI0035150FEA
MSATDSATDALPHDTLHEDALAALETWRAPDADQEELRRRYVAHLRAHHDGLRRSCRPDHLTASTLVLSHDGARVLLTLHAKARRWFQFGGHCEAGDTSLAAAALREAREESGVRDLELDPVPVHLDEHEVAFCRADPDAVPSGGDAGGLVHHLDVRFLAVAPAGAEHAVSEESLDVRWFPVDALPEAELAPLVRLARERRAAAPTP